MQHENEILDMLSRIARIDRASLTPETELAGVGVDSLDLVEVIFEVEERYGISVPYNANDVAAGSAAFATVGDVLNKVVSLIEQRELIAGAGAG